MSRLFKFDSLITPSIVKFLFYFGVTLSVIGSIGIVASGLQMMNYQFMLGLVYIIGAVLATVAGIVMSRVAAEMILVLFMIRDELAWQRQNIQTVKPILSVPAMAAE